MKIKRIFEGRNTDYCYLYLRKVFYFCWALSYRMKCTEELLRRFQEI